MSLKPMDILNDLSLAREAAGMGHVGLSPMRTIAAADRAARKKKTRIHLTPRQLDVLALLAEGCSNKAISRRLHIAVGTVKVHIAGILRELGVSNRLQAAVAAYRSDLVQATMERARPATPGHSHAHRARVHAESGAKKRHA